VSASAESPRSGGAAGAGLVPSQTSLAACILNLAPSAVADRRVRRLKRSVWASGHLHGIADAGKRPPVVWFVTLTYRGVDDWRPDHISAAVQRFRNWCKWRKVPCRYTWVAELQQRGAVHYHLLAWLPVGVQMPFWDKPSRAFRATFWPHGWSNTQVAVSGVGYLMKYLSKLGELTRFPKGLRLYGIGGLQRDGRSVRAWFNLPQWAKAAYGVGDLSRSAGRLVVRATGEVLAPVWRVLRVPGGLSLQKLREVPPRFRPEHVPLGDYPGAYSTWSSSNA
jgi:hypothetical protein